MREAAWMLGTLAGFFLLDFAAVELLQFLSTVTGAWPYLILPVVLGFAGIILAWVIWSWERWE